VNTPREQEGAPPGVAAQSLEIQLRLPDREKPRRSRWASAWQVGNDLVKSPIGALILGGGLVGLWPTIEHWLFPAKRLEDQARTDAALVVPFLSNLTENDHQRFDTTKAILLKLGEVSRNASADKQSAVFDAVNKALADKQSEGKAAPSLAWSASGAAYSVVYTASAPTKSEGAAALLGLPARALVYIQADKAEEKARASASELLSALQSQAILAPGVQAMPSSTIPDKSQVRYFNDDDLQSAQALAAFVGSQIGLPVIVARPKLDAKEGTLEVWFGKDVLKGR
jgi:hypothetical protein